MGGAGAAMEGNLVAFGIDPDYWHLLSLTQDVVVPVCHDAMTIG
jgi:hypothetical protein